MNKNETSYWNTSIKPMDVVKLVGIIGGIVFAVTFFVYEMQGLPPRVSKLEQDLPATREQLRNEMNELKTQVDRSDAKTDIILDDVKIIKGLLMKEGQK